MLGMKLRCSAVRASLIHQMLMDSCNRAQHAKAAQRLNIYSLPSYAGRPPKWMRA